MVIEDGVNGFLIPVNNQKSLVDKMLLIAGSSELTIKLSNNALKINNKLNVDNICKQWISLLQLSLNYENFTYSFYWTYL